MADCGSGCGLLKEESCGPKRRSPSMLCRPEGLSFPKTCIMRFAEISTAAGFAARRAYFRHRDHRTVVPENA
jgi:hypothetical protein